MGFAEVHVALHFYAVQDTGTMTGSNFWYGPLHLLGRQAFSVVSKGRRWNLINRMIRIST